MSSGTPYRRALKLQARRTLASFAGPCLAAASLLLIFSGLTRLTSDLTSAGLYYSIFDTQQLPVQTGLWQANASVMANLLSMMGMDTVLSTMGGVVFALQDGGGQVLVLPVAWRQLARMAAVHSVFFLLAVPLQYGVIRRFWLLLRGEPAPFRRIFAWYLDLWMTGRALVVELVLGMWQWSTRTLSMVPALFCLVAGSMAGEQGWFLLLLSVPLAILGFLGSYYLQTLLLPVRYLLAANPELSVRQAFSHGLRMIPGRRWEYFKLNLSFLPWLILSMVLLDLPSLYVVPYLYISNFLFLSGYPQTEQPRVAE